MITLDDYWMGRDIKYQSELNHDIIQNAIETVQRVNELLDRAAADGVIPGVNPATGTAVASGWRPRGINDHIINAAQGSKHLTALACDIRDDNARSLARWCCRNLAALGEIGLWMENPQWTPSWVHVQTVPPGSGRRIFIPSTSAPLTARLPEQEHIA